MTVKRFTYAVNVPEGRSGEWSIERFTVTRDEAIHGMMSSLGTGRYVCSGKYTRLVRGRGVKAITVMSDTHDEINDHLGFVLRSHGDVLIAGLGLGMCARACLHREDVSSITIIEQSPDVVKLVGPWLTRIAKRLRKKLTIVQANVMTWEPPSGVVYDFAWFDIWDRIDERNLPEMHALHRRFARRAKWKGSWGRSIIARDRRREAREAQPWR